MGDFPSGQRGQTVNLLSLTSVVRIHHPPPEKSTAYAVLFSIQAAGLAYHHRAKCGAYHQPFGLYLITRQRVSYLRLDDIQHFVSMIYRNKLRMIYNGLRH